MQGTDISILTGWYTRQPHLFDTLIYLIVFMGVARVTLGRRYTGRGSGRGGKAITVGVGLSLTVAASVSASRTGFTLDRLAPISWTILSLLLLMLMLTLLHMSVRRRTRSHQGEHRRDFPFPPGGARPVHVHLHTGPMPDPRRWGWWRRRSSSSDAPSQASRVAESVRAAETTLAKLLDAFAEHVRLHGLDHHPESLLIAIARTQRTVNHHAHRLLTLLARSGWRREPDKHLLAKDVESAVRRVAHNTALFHEAMRFAEAAIHGGNLELLRKSIDRMQMLERDSIRLTRMLEALIERLRAEHPTDSSTSACSSSSSSRASSTTRGRDAG
jgi:hypothetical protein